MIWRPQQKRSTFGEKRGNNLKIMENARNLFLIGPAGAGKTTVGKMLAEEMGLQFIDTDTAIEKRSGVDVAWIFDLEGEEGFRARESRMIQELTDLNGVLLATGAGSILKEKNRKRLISRGTVIYLETPIQQQIERTAKDKTRPLLQGTLEENQKTLEAMHEERAPLYQASADVTFCADKRSPRTLVAEIVDYFMSQRRGVGES